MLNDNDFAIYYTESGVRCLDNKIGICIMNELAKSNTTIATLARDLDLPVSTVFFNINKLENRGLIISHKDADDRRKVLYSNNSIKIVSSTSSIPSLHPTGEDIIGTIMDDDDYFYKGLVGFVCLSTVEWGFDISPLMYRIGNLIANEFKEEYSKIDSKECLEHIKKFAHDANCPEIFIESYLPLKISLKLRIAPHIDLSKVYICTISMIARCLQFSTGIEYVISSSTVNEDGNILTYTLEQSTSATSIPQGLFLGEEPVDLDIAKQDDEFCLLSTPEQKLVLVDNPYQIKIVKYLDESPETLKSLCYKMKVSQSTVFSNLIKLKEMNAVFVDQNVPGSNKYKNSGTLLIVKRERGQYDASVIKNILNNITEDSLKYYEGIFKYILSSFDYMGLDTSRFQYHIGHIFANVLIKRNPGMNADSLLETICNSKRGMENVLMLESFVPLKISMTNKMLESVGGRAMLQFYVGFMSEVISLSTGKKYSVVDITDGMKGSKPSFKFILEPNNDY